MTTRPSEKEPANPMQEELDRAEVREAWDRPVSAEELADADADPLFAPILSRLQAARR